MNYFIVFQNKTFREEHKLGILWAPLSDINGGPAKFHWSSMKDVKKGDIIFSIVSNSIIARGIALDVATEEQNPFSNDLWNREGWLIKVDYDFSYEKIKIMDHIEKLRNHLPNTYSPINRYTGRGNQGYLFPISRSLGLKIDELVSYDYQLEDANSVFEIDLETSDNIRHLYEEQGVDEGKITLLEIDRPEGLKKPKVKKRVIHGRKIDYLMKAKKDAETGMLAEILVVEHEKEYLINNGRDDLAKKVRWVAKEADGFGYDVLSYTLDGQEKFIEVKATMLDANQSFDVSANEVQTSKIYKENYWIYRVIHMGSNPPQYFKVNGSIEDEFELEPSVYKARIK